MSTSETVLGSVPLVEGRSEIRVILQTFKGNLYASARKFEFTPEKVWVATKNGLTVKPEVLQELLPLLGLAAEGYEALKQDGGP